MKKLQLAAAIVLTLCFSSFGKAPSDLDTLAREAISADDAVSRSAIRALRMKQQAGVEALIREYSSEIGRYRKTGVRTDLWKRISRVIDEVAMQKDAYASGLFWHIDFESALADAKSRNKPIISLRLLGNLNEEYSCANSRFFRSILYSNPEISANLRRNYVLHWESVRPAPKITVDFGDGRSIVRTITGNSIHYVLDHDGRIIDALPGLYTPALFNRYLSDLAQLDSTGSRYREVYWGTSRNSLLEKWNQGLLETGVVPVDNLKNVYRDAGESGDRDASSPSPTAITASRLAVTKALVEAPVVRSISYTVESLRNSTTFESWKGLAGLLGESGLDSNSREFIRLKTGRTNRGSDNSFERLIENLEEYAAVDTVQNEYLLHTKIYEWLASEPAAGVTGFNERVYDKLFLTPKSDKWLGLFSPEIYSAIDENGVIR